MYVEGETADKVTVDEEIGIVGSDLEYFFDIPIECFTQGFAFVFECFAERIRNLFVLVGKCIGYPLLHYFAVGAQDTHIEYFLTRLDGDVFEDIESELQLLNLGVLRSLAVVFVEFEHFEVVDFHHRRAIDDLCELLAFVFQLCSLL